MNQRKKIPQIHFILLNNTVFKINSFITYLLHKQLIYGVLTTVPATYKTTATSTTTSVASTTFAT